MAQGDSSLQSVGIRIAKNKEHALVYDVYDESGVRLTKQEFWKKYPSIMDGAVPDWSQIQSTKPRVLGEGDSWINILWPASSALGHEPCFFDMIEKSGRYSTLDRGWPGDTLQEIVADKDYKVIQSGLYDYFILSGSGNDVLGGGALRRFLKKKGQTDPAKPVETWLNLDEVNKSYDFIAQSYDLIARESDIWTSGRTKLLIHGYDYPVPVKGGEWLGTPLSERDYDLDNDMDRISKIVHFLVDGLYRVLNDVASNHPSVTVVNLRNLVAGRWNDELHPERPASQDIAAVFMSHMDAIA